MLEGLPEEYRFKPAIVATTVAVYEKAGDTEGIEIFTFITLLFENNTYK